jgi:hypothetical protein
MKRAMMKRAGERAIELAMEIGATRERLRHMEQELDRLRSEDGNAPATAETASGATAGNGMQPGSMASRVIELLGTHPEQAFEAPTIAQQLGIKNVNSLRGTLRRLADTKRIDKRSRGKFRARRESAAMT